MNQIAVRPPSEFETQLAQYEPQLAAVLPAHITPDKFRRVVVTAVNLNPDLLNADRRSLFVSCVRAAQDGLLPDGRESALVIFNKKNKKTGQYEKAVQYLPMVFGVLKRMRNSGDVNSIVAHVVHERDEFGYELGDDPKITHKPSLAADSGRPIAAYAIAKLANGEVQREVMTVAEIERARAVSRAKDDGPWTAWWGEMAKKTVIKRLSKRLPLSSDLERLIKRDEEAYEAISAPSALIGTPRPQREQFAAAPIMEERGAADEAADPLADFAGEHPPSQAGTGGSAEEAPPAASHDPDTGEVRDPEPVALEVPPGDAADKAWRTYAGLLRNAAATAPSRNWLADWQALNQDGLVALEERSKIAAKAVSDAVNGRLAELPQGTP